MNFPHFTLTETQLQVLVYAIKILVIFGAVLTSVPFMVYLERRLLARIQHRVGPNRVGPFGLLQPFVDGIKLFLKEDTAPRTIDKVLHALAPLLTVVPAIFVLAIVPIGPALSLSAFGHDLKVNLGITDLEIGILFYLAVTGIAVYGIVLAGWASNSKYSLLGGIRSSAQMLSYEIALGLSFVGVLLIAGTFELRALIEGQSGGFWNWNVIKQPVGFLLFLGAGFAETNRLPFDLPEGESELGGGFHTEYSSMKFAMFFMSEYMNMFTFSAILTTLFLGGFQGPIPLPFLEGFLAGPYTIPVIGISIGGIGAALIGVFWFSVKIFLLIAFMIFIRGTWPRFRYDQLMDLGWKIMFPIALVNMVVTAGVVTFLSPTRQSVGEPTGVALTVALFVAGVAQLVIVDRILTARRKRVLHRVA